MRKTASTIALICALSMSVIAGTQLFNLAKANWKILTKFAMKFSV
jgi:hypothetical protein